MTVTTVEELTAASRVHQIEVTTGSVTLADADGQHVINIPAGGTWGDIAGYPMEGVTATAAPGTEFTAITA